MSFEGIPTKWGSLVAAADLSAKQYYIVDVDTAGKAALCGAGEVPFGSLQNKPEAGYVAEVQVYGVAKVVAGAIVAVGASVTSDANGKAVTATTGDNVLGTALVASAADGDIIPVFITHAGVAD
jgi:hypothetical protein